MINIPIQKLDDHGILVKFLKNFDQNSFQKLDDHGILMKIFKDFDQNSVDKPQYPTIQTIEFFNK